MHLFYRTLCLIQFAQIRTARPSNYGLDKETEPTLGGRLLEENCASHSSAPSHHGTYSIPAIVCQAENTKPKFSLVEVADSWTDGCDTLIHTGRFNSTHRPALLLGNRAREESLWRLRLFLEGRKNEKCTTMHSNTQRISDTWGMNLRKPYIFCMLFF